MKMKDRVAVYISHLSVEEKDVERLHDDLDLHVGGVHVFPAPCRQHLGRTSNGHNNDTPNLINQQRRM